MSEWKKKRLGSITTSFAGGTPSRARPEYFGGTIPWISSSEVNQAFISDTNEKITQLGLENSSAKWIPKHSVLVAMYGATAGQVSTNKIEATSNQAVLALVPEKNYVDPIFLYYQIKRNKENILYLAQGSGQSNLSKDLIDNFQIDIPENIQVQKKVGVLLKTVDAVIEKTQAAIEKYKAIKQGMLHDLFTRGIDTTTGKLRRAYKDAPELYKETKLGWVPKEWEVERFESFIKKVDSGWSPNCHVEPANIGEWGSLKTTAVTWNGYDPNENKKLPSDIAPLKETEVELDDILITRVGPRERVGVVVHVNDGRKKLMVSDNMLRFKINKSENLYLPFLSLVLGSHHVQPEWQKRIAGLAEAQVVINQQIIKKTVVPLPAFEEQISIFVTLSVLTSKLKLENQYLNKLQQMKQGLMGDLLSGKKRVSVEEEVGES
jgi:type I restriction enzyme, S subunit